MDFHLEYKCWLHNRRQCSKICVFRTKPVGNLKSTHIHQMDAIGVVSSAIVWENSNAPISPKKQKQNYEHCIQIIGYLLIEYSWSKNSMFLYCLHWFLWLTYLPPFLLSFFLSFYNSFANRYENGAPIFPPIINKPLGWFISIVDVKYLCCVFLYANNNWEWEERKRQIRSIWNVKQLKCGTLASVYIRHYMRNSNLQVIP